MLTLLLLYGGNTLTDDTNTFLLNSVIEYITSTAFLKIDSTSDSFKHALESFKV